MYQVYQVYLECTKCTKSYEVALVAGTCSTFALLTAAINAALAVTVANIAAVTSAIAAYDDTARRFTFTITMKPEASCTLDCSVMLTMPECSELAQLTFQIGRLLQGQKCALLEIDESSLRSPTLAAIPRHTVSTARTSSACSHSALCECLVQSGSTCRMRSHRLCQVPACHIKHA